MRETDSPAAPRLGDRSSGLSQFDLDSRELQQGSNPALVHHLKRQIHQQLTIGMGKMCPLKATRRSNLTPFFSYICRLSNRVSSEYESV